MTVAEYAAHLAAIRADLGFGSTIAADEQAASDAPYDDGGTQPCGCHPEFHSSRCTGAR